MNRDDWRRELAELKAMVEEVVCHAGEDCGVILLSQEAVSALENESWTG